MKSPSISIERLYGCTAIIQLMEMSDAVRRQIRDRLASLLHTALTSQLPRNDLSTFVAGAAFGCYVHCSDIESVDLSLWSTLCNAGSRFCDSLRFLQALLAYIKLASR